MLKIRLVKSKQFKRELKTLNKIPWDDTKYNYFEKKLKFKGANKILKKAIKLLHPINITFTESQPSAYQEETYNNSSYYFTAPGIIILEIDYYWESLNRKTKYNLKTINNALNYIYGYEIDIKDKNRQFSL